MIAKLYRYIEVKRNGVWKPFKFLADADEPSLNEDDEIIEYGEGNKFKVNFVFNDGLGLRDMLSRWCHKADNLTSRGLPEDVTDEVKKHVEDNGGWGVSYATISELDEAVENEIEEWNKDVIDTFNKRFEIRIGRKLDKIEALLKKETLVEGDNDAEESDDVEFRLGELFGGELYDFISEKSEIMFLYWMVSSNYGWISEDNVRVIWAFG